MNQQGYIVILTLFSYLQSFFTCNPCSDGYHSVDEGVCRKVFIIGDETKPVYPNSYTKIDYKLMDINTEQIMLQDTGIYIYMSEPYHQEILKALSQLNLGDSACYIISRPGNHSTDSIKNAVLHIAVRSILTPHDYEKMKLDMELRSEKKELEEIQHYLSVHDQKKWKLLNGMYYQLTEKGNGTFVKKGDLVTIHYHGYFLDGTKFDSTIDYKEPFSFVFGDPQQVVKGFELAISMMKKNSKIKIILPSQLAFGENGSSNKKIKPFTPLLYEIEVLSINQPI